MLTVKYVKCDSGEEIICECHTIIADRCDDGRRRIAAHTDIPGSPGDQVGYYFGPCAVKHSGKPLPPSDVLYVMNRFGSTVSVYHFEGQSALPEPA